MLVASYSWLVTRIPHPPSRFARPPPGFHPRKLCLRAGSGGGGHWGVLVTGVCCPQYGLWGLDHPAATTHENCIFVGPGIVPPLRRGELYSATGTHQVPLHWRGGRHRAPRDVSRGWSSPGWLESAGLALTCHSRARGPRKYERICGVVKAGIGLGLLIII